MYPRYVTYGYGIKKNAILYLLFFSSKFNSDGYVKVLYTKKNKFTAKKKCSV